MATKVAINGFGRIGRLVARAILSRTDHDLELVSINDLGDANANALLFKRDSVHGNWAGEVSVDGDVLVIDGKKIKNLQVVPFFNMVDRRRDLHVQMLVKRPALMKNGLKTWIPYSTHVEQMGDHRAPVGEFAPYTPAAQAFRALWFEVLGRLKL